MELIEKSNDKENKEKEENEKIKKAQEAEQQVISLTHQEIEKKLRERIKFEKQEESVEKRKNLIEDIEKGKNIKWELNGKGDVLTGFCIIDQKKKTLIPLFKIKKGLTIWNLYLDKSLLEDREQSYFGCSSTILKLKERAEKIVAKRILDEIIW